MIITTFGDGKGDGVKNGDGDGYGDGDGIPNDDRPELIKITLAIQITELLKGGNK